MVAINLLNLIKQYWNDNLHFQLDCDGFCVETCERFTHQKGMENRLDGLIEKIKDVREDVKSLQGYWIETQQIGDLKDPLFTMLLNDLEGELADE